LPAQNTRGRQNKETKMQKWTIDNSNLAKYGLCVLSKHEGETIELLNLGELQALKRQEPETILISINGTEVAAKDADEDTRIGYVAYGFLEGFS
jgi:hypothetical protein